MTEQVQDQAPVIVKSPLELAIAKYKLAATRLSKVETRAAEFDAEAAKLNAEMAAVCLGTQPQTKDRTVMVIAKEQDAAVKKAAKVRKSGGQLAREAREALAELTDITATLGAAYPVDLSDEDDEAEAPEVEGEDPQTPVSEDPLDGLTE